MPGSLRTSTTPFIGVELLLNDSSARATLERTTVKLFKVIAFALAGLATGASAQIVSNGSFETFTGAFGGDGGAQLIGSSTTLTGWTIVGGEIAVLRSPNGYNLAASVGNNFLDLAGYSNGGFPKGISQMLTGLTVGHGARRTPITPRPASIIA